MEGRAQLRFTRQWDAARPAVAAYLYARTGDHALVDELLQEVAVAAWDGQRCEEDEHTTAWIMGIARHKLADAFQARRRSSRIQLDQLPEEPIDSAAEQVAELLAARSRAMRHCLERLDGRQRRLLERRYQQEQDLHDMAADLQVSPGSLKVRLHRIRSAVRRCVQHVLGSGEEG